MVQKRLYYFGDFSFALRRLFLTCQNIELINVVRENYVILLYFLPYTTHRLQPFDVFLMAPLSAFYEREVRKWLINHPSRVVIIYQIEYIFRDA